MKPDTASKMSKLSPIAAHDQALSIANYKGTLIAGKLVDRSITINLSTGEWLKFQVSLFSSFQWVVIMLPLQLPMGPSVYYITYFVCFHHVVDVEHM